MTTADRDQSDSVTSPDESITMTVDLLDGVPHYSVAAGGTTYVEPSPIGFEFADQPPFGTAVGGSGPEIEVTDSRTTTATEEWEPIWGAFESVSEPYHQLTLALEETAGPERSATLDVRVFDDGLGFRITLGEGFGEFTVVAETTEFAFGGDYTAWWIENEFVNPRYEQEYTESSLSEIPSGTKTTSPNGNRVRRGVHTPLTMRADDGTYLSVHEANLDGYASTSLASIDDDGSAHMAAELAPLPDGTKVHATAPHSTPWRTIQFADDPGGLIESQLLALLAPERDDSAFPGDTEDIDWLRPRKYVGVWWMMIAGSANWEYRTDEQLRADGIDPATYVHGARTERTKRYMRFASEHGFDSVLVEGWNEGWDTYPGDGSGFEMGIDDSYPDFDLDGVLEYGATLPNPVEMTMHNETGGNVANYESELDEDIFEAYAQAGIHSVKNGYVSDPGLRLDDGTEPTHNHHCQAAVAHHRGVIERAAENRQMLEIHEGIEPTGEIRTYPHVGAREVVKAQEYDGFGELRADVAREHHVVLPFTRMIAGPTSYQPGIFDLTFHDGDPGRIQTTRAKQLAMYPVYLGGLQMVGDRMEAYLDPSLSVGQFLHASAGDLDGTITADTWRDSFGGHYVPIDPSREPAGASVSYTVTDVPEAGTYDLHLRYAADEETNRQAVRDNGTPEATLVVGDTQQPLRPDWTDYWDDWRIHTVPIDLEAGENTVKIQLAEDVGGFNLNAIAVSDHGDPSPVPAAYEDVDPSNENVETVPEFEFVERVPLDWDETRVLDAAIGDYVVTARRKGSEWYLGAMADEQPRAVEISLSFLEERPEGWSVTAYTDAAGTDVTLNPMEVAIDTFDVEADETLSIEMAESGGAAMRFRPAGEADGE
ncbi:MAG: glycoside hydrolase family 97 catalytic domain-containing protein [Halapricum sp.]